MAEYIGCRNCDSPDCKGCNLKNLETMLNNGKFDCMMNENRCINPAADVAPVRHGRWERKSSNWYCTNCGKGYRICCGSPAANTFDYCPNCGAKMARE